MFIQNAFADGAVGAGGFDINLVLLPLMFVVLYFMMIRPQMKRQKEHRNMVSALSRGDEVMVGGIVGKIADMDENYISLEVSKGVTIQVQRAAVGTLLPKGTAK
jgi:preprotein translocase subunit YajC